MKMLILNVIVQLIQILKYVCIYDLFFSTKIRNNWKKIIAIVVGAVVLYWVMRIDICNPLIPYTIYMVIVTVILYERFDARIVLLGIWSYFVIALLDEAIRIVNTKVFSILATHEILERYITNLVALLLLFIIATLLKRKINGRIEKISISYFIFLLVLTIMETLIITFLSQFVFQQVEVENKILVYVSFGATIVGMFVQIILVILLAASRDVYRQKDELSQKYLSEQTQHYAYLEKRETETKRFRHDIKGHIALLSDILQSGDLEKAKEYMHRINGELSKVDQVVSVNNGIVDAILNRYCSEAMNDHVELHIKGRLPARCNIDAFDLCTIFSNLLSNAYEAVGKCERKCIEVECGYIENIIVIKIENDYTEGIEYQDEKFLTSKEDKEYHGFGIQNVERSVQKYSGNMVIEAKEKFLVRIRMVNKTYETRY